MAGIQPEGGVPPSQTLNAITNPDLAAGCENLWHSIRCNPKFDPVAANAVIAEIINAVNCFDREYDCSKLDNLCLVLTDVRNYIHGCLEQQFPEATGCTLEQLVLSTDAAGCMRIARYSDAAAQLGASDFSVFYPANNGVILPADAANPATYYSNSELRADQAAGTINDPKLNSTRITRLEFSLECASLIEMCFTSPTLFEPAANGGNGRASQIVPRIDGVFPDNGVSVLTMATFTNFDANAQGCITRQFTAGAHVIELFLVRANASTQAARMSANWTIPTAIGGDLTISRAIS